MIYAFYFTKVVLHVCVFRSPSGVWQQSWCGSDFDFSFYHQIFLAELRRNSSPQGVAPEIRFKRHVQTNLQPIHLHEDTDRPRHKEVHVAPPGLRLAALNNQELTFWLWLDKVMDGARGVSQQPLRRPGNQTSHLPERLFVDQSAHVPRSGDPSPGSCRWVVVKRVPLFSALPRSIQTITVLFQQSFFKPAHCAVF